MSATWLRVLEHIHGHLGWLSVAALIHPAVLLRHRARRAVLSCVLAAFMSSVTLLLGAVIYPSYRSQLKRGLFLDHPSIGWWFERKEHLALGVIAFAWVGFLSHLAAPKLTPEQRPLAERLAHRAFVMAAALSVVVAATGVVAAVTAPF